MARHHYGDVSREVETSEWLWPGWLAKGHSSLILAPPGEGKTALGVGIIDVLLFGRCWPGTETRAPTAPIVSWYNSEGTEGVTKDRFLSFKIPLDRVVVPFSTVFDNPDLRDPEVWRNFTEEVQAEAADGSPILMIDTFGGAFRGYENRKEQIDPFMRALNGLARQTGMHFCFLHHPRKRSGELVKEKLTLEDIRGSTAILANVRTAMIIEKVGVTESGRDCYQLRMHKSNLGRMPEPAAFIIEEGCAEFCKIEVPDKSKTKNKGVKFLDEALNGGRRRLEDILKDGKDQGISRATIYRARDIIGVIPDRDSESGDFYWRKPLEIVR